MQLITQTHTINYAALIAKRLVWLRRHFALTQQELADRIETTQNVIVRMENQLKTSISPFIRAILFFQVNYHISANWLLNPLDDDMLFPLFTYPSQETFQNEPVQQLQKLASLQELIDSVNQLPSNPQTNSANDLETPYQ